MLLVKEGHFPGGMLSIYTDYYLDGQDSQGAYSFKRAAVTEDQLFQVITELEKFGLFCHVVNRENRGVTDIFYSNNEDWLSQAPNDSNYSDDEVRGLFFGIPETARKAFVADKCIEEDEELPDSIKKSKYFRLLPFRLSKEHALEEWGQFESKMQMIERKWSQFVGALINEANSGRVIRGIRGE